MKDRLKRIAWLRRIVKRGRIVIEYLHDIRHLNRHMLDVSSDPARRQYEILLLVHSLEKGLSYRNPRAFGFEKARELARLLDALPTDERHSTAVRMALGALSAWLDFHDDRPDDSPTTVETVRGFLDEWEARGAQRLPAGVIIPEAPSDAAFAAEAFAALASTRHSIRHYGPELVDDEAIARAVAVAKTSPSACNRQMVKLRVFDEPEQKRALYSTLLGTGGLDYETGRYGVVTYDASSLTYYGERNQGFLNAGLFTMTLVLAFHSQGIGTCLLQFSNSYAAERRLAKTLGLPPAERIAVGIGIGNPVATSPVPASVRKPTGEIFSVRTEG